MKTKIRTISREDRGAPALPPLQQSGSPDAARDVVAKIIRRQGYLLSSIHAVCMEELIKHSLERDAEFLNNEVKPLVDAMIHFGFDAERTIDDGEFHG